MSVDKGQKRAVTTDWRHLSQSMKITPQKDILTYLITKMFDRIFNTYLSKLMKLVADQRSSLVFKTHKESMRLVADSKLLVTKDADKLQVKDVGSNKMYNVTLAFSQAHKCHEACVACGFCLHTFQCDCQQNQLSGNFCVHLHALSKAKDILPV